MAEEGKSAGADQSSTPDPRLVSEGAISDEALRKAEEFVEQEEGAANRLTGWAGHRRHRDRDRDDAVPSLRRLRHRADAAAALHPRRLRDGAVLPAVSARRRASAIASAGGTWSRPRPAVAILVYAIWGGEDFTDRATSPTGSTSCSASSSSCCCSKRRGAPPAGSCRSVGILFIAYAMLGPYLPPPWTHRGYDLSRLVGHLFITLEGIFGVAVDVSSTLIIMFTIYGAFLQHSGAGKFFIDFSMALMGGKPNSAGRTVVLSSFLLGGPSGSGVATTVTIGAVAYPMMERAGLREERRRRTARRRRARRDPVAAGARRRRLPDRRVSQDQLSRRDLDGDHPDLSLLPVAAVHGRARRQALRRERGALRHLADARGR